MPEPAAPARADPLPLVIVADDDRFTLRLVERVITAIGCRVVAVDGGRAALEAAARERPALVILDAVMPGLGGLDVLARLRADPALARVPVMLLTGLEPADGGDPGAAPDAWLRKPFTPADLRAKVRALVRLAGD